MAHYIAYATMRMAGTSDPREMRAQVNRMLELGLWGIPVSAQLKDRPMPGDGLIVAVGAPYRQFVGDGVVASRFRRFTADEIARLPPRLQIDHGITLTRARSWRRPRLIAELWPQTAAAERDPNAQFLAALRTVSGADAALIVSAGAGERGATDVAPGADALHGGHVVTDQARQRPEAPPAAAAPGPPGRDRTPSATSAPSPPAPEPRPVLEPRRAVDFARRALAAAAQSRAGLPCHVAHADWGTAAAKQVVATADLQDGAYHAHAPAVVKAVGGLTECVGLDVSEGQSALLGFDFPIGVPRAYARLAGFENFADWLRELDIQSPFFQVAADLAEVSTARPFFPRNITEKSPGVKEQHRARLGMSGEEMLRRADRAHCHRGAASEMFWTLGAKAVGKATLDGWRRVVRPALAEPHRTCTIWPFDGALTELLECSDAVIVETYPAEFYRPLGLRIGTPGTSKTSQADRRKDALRILECCAENAVVPDDDLTDQILDGFGGGADGEDSFDAVVGLVGMIRTLRSAPEPELPAEAAVRELEGWMFGQHADCMPAHGQQSAGFP